MLKWCGLMENVSVKFAFNNFQNIKILHFFDVSQWTTITDVMKISKPCQLNPKIFHSRYIKHDTSD